MSADIALVGLAVMGQNLILNMADHGFKVVAFNRTVSKVQDFLENEAAGNPNVVGAQSVEDMVSQLKSPKRIMLMVKAGSAVDAFIDMLLPHLQEGDIIIDGGNSHFPDSERRYSSLKEKGLLFVGCGVSGGEEGARYGPSMMPGGNPAAWPHVKDIFTSICAKVGNEPCCDWVGEGGSGHYVKMVHNGIEYGDMQLISETYQLMKDAMGLSHDEMSKIFEEWNRGKLDSYLIEITAAILKAKDTDGAPLLEKILDAAGQKGTGKWTAVSALDTGMPVTLIGEAVFARCLSALKNERVQAAELLGNTTQAALTPEQITATLTHLPEAVYASKLVSYAQGFMLLAAAAKEHNWALNYGGIALMWRGGCIIRSAFLGDITRAYQTQPSLSNLLLAPFFADAMKNADAAWRQVLCTAVMASVPLPCMSAALAFYDGFRTARGSANMIQAQRDFFGAHTFERVDAPRGQFFHHNWTGHGGTTASSTYNV